jgi:hypothetical protein
MHLSRLVNLGRLVNLNGMGCMVHANVLARQKLRGVMRRSQH